MLSEASSSKRQRGNDRQTSFVRVVVAIDGSVNGKKAADTAIEIAKRFGSQLFILHVIPTISYHSEKLQGEFVNVMKRDAEGLIEKTISQAKREGLKVRGEIVSSVPSTIETIIDYASEWKVDLIVVGTRGLSGFKKLLLGSVSSGVVAHAACDVLVVR